MVAYACVDGRARVLLAFDPHPERRAWAAFGGAPESTDEPAAATAAREFHEETNCAYSTPTAAELSSAPLSVDGGFHTFVARVPYMTADEIASRTGPCRHVERSDWLWVGFEELVSALSSDDTAPSVPVIGEQSRRVPVWSKAAGSLRNAIRDGAVPDSDPCSSETLDR